VKMRLSVVVAFVFMCVFPWWIEGSAPDDGSCVKCHTDAEVMKSLVKVPVAIAGEGEG
jgi:hypothetical protein